jgi:DNA-binding MarR family transcriptional regulator
MIPIDIDRIDDVIHGRVRLGIMTYLVNADTADFNELKAALNTTQGNPSIHLTKLEEAGYISITKSFWAASPTRARA